MKSVFSFLLIFLLIFAFSAVASAKSDAQRGIERSDVDQEAVFRAKATEATAEAFRRLAAKEFHPESFWVAGTSGKFPIEIVLFSPTRACVYIAPGRHCASQGPCVTISSTFGCYNRQFEQAESARP